MEDKRMDEEGVLDFKARMDKLDAGFEFFMYFDKKGKPLTTFEWTILFGMDDYKRIALDELKNGYTVSTVWLGLNHSWSLTRRSKPLIFETMVFPECEEMVRYSTLEEAKKGHAKKVKEYETKKAAKWTKESKKYLPSSWTTMAKKV